MRQAASDPSKLLIVAAFGAIYVVWGSTYLAIRFAVETLPPFTMAGLRFLAAGIILYAWTRMRGTPRPTVDHWKTAAIIGALMLVAGNGGVSWAEQTVPSGIAALVVALVPLWVVIITMAKPGGKRPTVAVVVGLILGMAGLAMLIGPSALVGGADLDRVGAWVIVFASFSWALGSVYASTAPQHPSMLVSAGLQMITGGAILLVGGFVLGERVAIAAISFRSISALTYLIVFGSIISYTAYNWLLRNTDTAKVSTYAYVNPIVAVFLGWALADEVVNARILLAAGIIVGAVALIISAKVRNARKLAIDPRPSARPAAMPEYSGSSRSVRR